MTSPLSKEASGVLSAARTLTAQLVNEIGLDELSKELDMSNEDDGSRAVYTFVRSVLAYEAALAEFEHQ